MLLTCPIGLTMFIDAVAEHDRTIKMKENGFETNQHSTDQNILNALSMSPGQLLSNTVDGAAAADAAHFILDETTLRTLQQLMESHDLHPENNPSDQV